MNSEAHTQIERVGRHDEDDDMELPSDVDDELDAARNIDTPTEVQVQLKRCTVCLQDLAWNKFPMKNGIIKGSQCSQDSAGIEAMQRLLRVAWQEEYKIRYSGFKENKAMFRRIAIGFGKDTSNNTKRKIPVVAELLVQKKVKAHRTRTTKKRLPMTWAKFEEYFAQAAHGGYSHSQLEAKWEKLQETGTKSDRKGVIAGVGNQKRLWVSVSSEEASDDESAVVNEHEQQAKAKNKNAFTTDEVEEFLDGSVTLGEGSDLNVNEAIQLADSIDVALGRAPMPRRASSSSSHVPSMSSADLVSSSSAAAAPSATTVSPLKNARIEEAKNKRWMLDKRGKIESVKSDWQSQVQEYRQMLTACTTSIADARQQVPVHPNSSLSSIARPKSEIEHVMHQK